MRSSTEEGKTIRRYLSIFVAICLNVGRLQAKILSMTSGSYTRPRFRNGFCSSEIVKSLVVESGKWDVTCTVYSFKNSILN